jgi:DNA-binding response OmpR family regulator
MTVSSPDVSTERLTVLVVDDETALTDSLAVWLSEEYAVRTAYCGEEAIEAYDSSVGVVLLDRRLPDLDGERVLERLRAESGDPAVAILTAADPHFRAEALDSSSFEEYLKKPITREELLAAVARLAALKSDSDSDI